uniref:Uncharacterized protein n=1 Tax=Rhizophora mucronata TaxID=61149 RepID=A0A2P2NTX6_RHIMU
MRINDYLKISTKFMIPTNHLIKFGFDVIQCK